MNAKNLTAHDHLSGKVLPCSSENSPSYLPDKNNNIRNTKGIEIVNSEERSQFRTVRLAEEIASW